VFHKAVLLPADGLHNHKPFLRPLPWRHDSQNRLLKGVFWRLPSFYYTKILKFNKALSQNGVVLRQRVLNVTKPDRPSLT